MGFVKIWVHIVWTTKNRDPVLTKEVRILMLLKGESSFWINRNKFFTEKFEWQDDYFDVSVSESAMNINLMPLFRAKAPFLSVCPKPGSEDPGNSMINRYLGTDYCEEPFLIIGNYMIF